MGPGHRGKAGLTVWVVLAALALVAVVWLRLPRNPMSREDIEKRKGHLVSARILGSERVDALVSEDVEIVGSSGLILRCLILRPDTTGIRFPALILQGGLDRGREALEPLPKDEAQMVWAAFDYPYQLPRRRGALAYAPEVPRAYRGMQDAAAAFLLLVDYLETRPDVDTTRVVAAGASLGGYLAVIAGAVDPRVDGVAALYCGGKLEILISELLEYRAHTLRRSVAAGLHPWIGSIDPVLYAARISPRPFILVNGLHDTTVPRECAIALFDAAREPKQHVWLETPHKIIEDEDLLREVGDEMYAWLRENGFIPAPDPRPPVGETVQ